MKIICCGDWHIRATPTKFRTSEYYDQMLTKIKYIMNFAIENSIFIVLQPGDFFDSPDIPNRVFVDIIKSIGPAVVHVVFGQHDTKHRRTEDTALAVFIESEAVELLTDKPTTYDERKVVDIYGSSWGESIPIVVNPKHYNILVLHKMIVKDKPLFPDQKNYINSTDFAESLLNYDLVVSGDNHNSFSYLPEDAQLPSIVNCGSLMRMTTAQYDHKPCFWVVDTITEGVKKYVIPILPTIEVFKEEAIEIKERDEKMEAFIRTLDDTKLTTQLSFEANAQELLATTKMKSSIGRLINGFIKDYYSQEKP